MWRQDGGRQTANFNEGGESYNSFKMKKAAEGKKKRSGFTLLILDTMCYSKVKTLITFTLEWPIGGAREVAAVYKQADTNTNQHQHTIMIPFSAEFITLVFPLYLLINNTLTLIINMGFPF